jgi:hypothetical protein
MRDWMFYKLENHYLAQTAELLKEPRDPEGWRAAFPSILDLLDSSDDKERKRGLALLRQRNVPFLGPDANRIQWQRKPGRPKAQPRHTPPPEPPKGTKLPANRAYWRYSELVHMAKKAVRIIQNFWREDYDGKWQRSRDDIDAYKIAAQYFCVDVEDVKRKRPGRHKPKTKQP